MTLHNVLLAIVLLTLPPCGDPSMKNLTPANTFGTVSVPEDGIDRRTAASVEVPLQALTNRDAYLQDLVAGAGTGIKRVAQVGGAADVAALTGMVNGDVVMVSGGDIEGVSGQPGMDPLMYRYTSGSAFTADGFMVIAPDVGAGRWVAIGYGARGLAGGWASLNSDGKVPASQMQGFFAAHYGTLLTDGAGGVAIVAGSSGTFTVAIETTNIRVTFNANMASAGYAPLVTGSGTAGSWYSGSLGVGSFLLRLDGVDLSAVSRACSFTVIGPKA
jgi:hypothetical protein